MGYADYLWAALLQAVTEFLPVSSKSIVLLYLTFAGWTPVRAYQFALLLHFPSALALIVVLRRELWAALFDAEYRRSVLIALMASFGVGVPLYWLVLAFLAQVSLIEVSLLIGAILVAIGTVHMHWKVRGTSTITDKAALLSGILQGVAVIPGVTRLGATLLGLFLYRTNPKEALSFSYLIGTPVMIASALEVLVLESVGIGLNVVVALIVCCIASVGVCVGLLKLAERTPMWVFTLGTGVLILVFFTALAITGKSG